MGVGGKAHGQKTNASSAGTGRVGHQEKAVSDPGRYPILVIPYRASPGRSRRAGRRPHQSRPLQFPFFWVQIHYGSHAGLLFPILLCTAVSCACSWLIRDEVILIRPVQAPKVPLCFSQAIAKPSHKLLKTRKQEEPLQSLQEVEQMQSQSQILITRMSGNI